MLSEILTPKFEKLVSKNKVALIRVDDKLRLIERLTLIKNPIVYRNKVNVAMRARSEARVLFVKYFLPINSTYYYWGENVAGCCYGQSKDKVPNGVGLIMSRNKAQDGLSDDYKHALLDYPEFSKVPNLANYKVYLDVSTSIDVLACWIYDASEGLNFQYGNIVHNIPSNFRWDNKLIYDKKSSLVFYSMNQSNPQGEYFVSRGFFAGLNNGYFDGDLYFNPYCIETIDGITFQSNTCLPKGKVGAVGKLTNLNQRPAGFNDISKIVKGSFYVDYYAESFFAPDGHVQFYGKEYGLNESKEWYFERGQYVSTSSEYYTKKQLELEQEEKRKKEEE
jgi:hypothetical protein